MSPGNVFLYGPVTYNPTQTRPKSTLLLHLCRDYLLRNNNTCKYRCHIYSPTRDASFIRRERHNWHPNFCAAPHFWYDSTQLFRLKPTQFSNSIWLILHMIYFWFKSKNISYSKVMPQGTQHQPKCSKKNRKWNRGIFENLKIVIDFGKDTLIFTKIGKRRRDRKRPPIPNTRQTTIESQHIA